MTVLIKHHKVQQEFLNYPEDRCSVVSGRRGGKTFICIEKLVKESSISYPILYDYLYLLPSTRQAYMVIWPQVFDHLNFNWKISPFYSATHENGNKVHVSGVDQLDKFEGLKIKGIILDEASDLYPGLLESRIYPMLEKDAFLYLTGVPNKDRPGYKNYKDFAMTNVQFWWPSTDMLNKQQIEEMKSMLSKNEYKQLIEGRFI